MVVDCEALGDAAPIQLQFLRFGAPARRPFRFAWLVAGLASGIRVHSWILGMALTVAAVFEAVLLRCCIGIRGKELDKNIWTLLPSPNAVSDFL